MCIDIQGDTILRHGMEGGVANRALLILRAHTGRWAHKKIIRGDYFRMSHPGIEFTC